MIPGKQYSFDTLTQIGRRRKWLIMIPALLIATGGAFWVRRMPDRYRSEALIQVVPQRIPESYVRPTVTSRIEDRLQAITQQILSRTRLEQIVHDFDLYPRELAGHHLMEDIVERMRTTDIAIAIVKGDAFRVSYSADHPRTAMRVTERLASLFIDESLRDREVLAEGTNQFLATELDEARRQLVLNEKRIEQYQAQHTGGLPSQMAANLQGLQNAGMALQTTGESLNRDRERRLLLERAVTEMVDAADTPAARGGAAPATMAQTLADELRLAEQALLAAELKLTAEHPDVKRLRRNVVELQKRVDTRALEASSAARPSAPVAIDPARRKRLADAQAELASLDRQLASRVADEARLRGELRMYQARIEAAPAREAELAALTRDYDTLQQSYRGLLRKKEDSQISANLEKRQIGEQFKILDPGRLPEQPDSPDRPRLYLIVVLAGLAIGLAGAALAEYFDRTLRSEADVRAALNLMVLATVPYVRDAVASGRLVRRRLAVGLGVATVMTGCALAAWRLLP